MWVSHKYTELHIFKTKSPSPPALLANLPFFLHSLTHDFHLVLNCPRQSSSTPASFPECTGTPYPSHSDPQEILQSIYLPPSSKVFALPWGTMLSQGALKQLWAGIHLPALAWLTFIQQPGWFSLLWLPLHALSWLVCPRPQGLSVRASWQHLKFHDLALTWPCPPGLSAVTHSPGAHLWSLSRKSLAIVNVMRLVCTTSM